jgi:2'-5' RNA ligase
VSRLVRARQSRTLSAVKDFWRAHAWPDGQRRYHWLVVFDEDHPVHACHAAHAPVLRRFPQLVDLVPAEWLHLTIQSLCPTTDARPEEIERLAGVVRERLADTAPPRVQLGPARPDGGAVTWAVYPEQELAAIQSRVRRASVEVLGEDRVWPQARHWWPHVTLAYGAADDPADDLAAALVRDRLPRVDITITELALVDEEQDLRRREFRWREIGRVPLGGAGSGAA